MSTSRTYAAGAVLTAAQQNDLAQGTLGYAQVTANQTGIGATADLTGLTVTVTVVAGRRIKITGSCEQQNSIATATVALRIQEGATLLKKTDVVVGAANNDEGFHVEIVLQPSAGSHTYKLVSDRGSGTTQMSAATTNPAFLLVEDIGT